MQANSNRCFHGFHGVHRIKLRIRYAASALNDLSLLMLIKNKYNARNKSNK